MVVMMITAAVAAGADAVAAAEALRQNPIIS